MPRFEKVLQKLSVMGDIVHKDRKGGRKNLKDFTRLGLAFYGGLLLISCYQQIQLFSQGILDSIFSTSLLLLALHQLGFAAILALLLSFVFNALESRQPQLGARLAACVFLGMLGVELLLTEYFITRYGVPGSGLASGLTTAPKYPVLRFLLGFSALCAGFYAIYKRSGGLQLWIGRMYPFTIVLFSMFLATLLSEKRPVNQNKTELTLVSWFNQDATAASAPAGPHPLYGIPPVSRPEMIWVHSVFSGNDFDKAYRIAMELAHEGELDKARSLAGHILWEVPGHADAEILMGRLLSWEESFEASTEILQRVVRNHPEYEDAYAALLDTFFWSGQHHKALQMQYLIERHLGDAPILQAKLERSRQALRESGVTATRQKAEEAPVSKALKAPRP